MDLQFLHSLKPLKIVDCTAGHEGVSFCRVTFDELDSMSESQQTPSDT